MYQNFSRQNLRGRSFRGQNLEGADFSYADLKGTNFTGANLQRVNFTGAKAGLQRYWALCLVMLSWLVSGISGFLFLYNGILTTYIFNSSDTAIENQISGWIALIVTIIVYIIIIRQGIGVNLAFAVAFAVAGTFAIAGVVAVAGAGVGTKTFSVAFAVAGTFAGAVAGAVSGAFAIAGTFAVGGIGAVIVAFAFAVAVAGAGARVGAVSFVGVGSVISTYVVWQAMKGDKKYTLIQVAAVAFAAIGGTSFQNADLTDANFTSAQLKSTDLRKAKLTRTCFHKTKLLDRVRPGTSYLKYPYIRQLLTTGQGQDKIFDRLNLRGINLKKAFLTDASFIGTDLSKACLQDADLSRAKLVQTQLDATDFTGATLTGAYIEDWGITNKTNFRGVRCEYVYMRLPTKENPDPLRKPDNNAEVFADGEFGDFIQPIFDTLDLYHNQGVDPRAIAISFKELAENNPDAELEIVAMERRGENKFLLRAKTTQDADKSQLSAEYFEIYNQVQALTQQEVQALIAEKDSRIRSLENFVNTALKSPSFYSNTQIEEVSNMTNNPGGFSVGGSVGGNINNVQGNNNRTIQGDNNQGVLGDGNQVTQSQGTASTEEPLTKEQVIELLAELDKLVRGAELPEDTKEEATMYLGAAKKATEKEEPKKKTALANLESMAETLETAGKTVDAGKNLWDKAKPIILKVAGWLGAAAGSYILGL